MFIIRKKIVFQNHLRNILVDIGIIKRVSVKSNIYGIAYFVAENPCAISNGGCSASEMCVLSTAGMACLTGK